MAGKMLAIAGGDRMGKAMGAANNISLPEPLLAEIRSAAQAEHRSVDDVLTDAVKRYVEERSWTKLLDYGAERAKTLGVKESDVDRLITESRAEQRSH
jgi:metal-responsive CopG/Arc/MetJ family transcriptional regulator